MFKSYFSNDLSACMSAAGWTQYLITSWFCSRGEMSIKEPLHLQVRTTIRASFLDCSRCLQKVWCWGWAQLEAERSIWFALNHRGNWHTLLEIWCSIIELLAELYDVYPSLYPDTTYNSGSKMSTFRNISSIPTHAKVINNAPGQGQAQVVVRVQLHQLQCAFGYSLQQPVQPSCATILAG